MGARFHYLHVILIGGIIVMAVGNDLTMEAPQQTTQLLHSLVLCAGPVIFLAGSAFYKKTVYRKIPVPHLAGAVVLCLIPWLIAPLRLECASWVTTVVLLLTALAEGRVHRRRREPGSEE